MEPELLNVSYQFWFSLATLIHLVVGCTSSWKTNNRGSNLAPTTEDTWEAKSSREFEWDPALWLLMRWHEQSRGNSFQWIIILNCIFCRYKEEEKRFRVPLALPIIMCVIYLYLVVMPIINKPSWYFLVAILFGLGGLIFYIPFAYLSDKCQWFDRITIFFQLLLRLGVADKDF